MPYVELLTPKNLEQGVDSLGKNIDAEFGGAFLS
jgi:hypothetical protein